MLTAMRRAFLRTSASASLTLLLAGCGRSETAVVVERPSGATKLLASETPQNLTSPSLSLTANRLKAARPIWRVGSVDGRPETQWGFVRDVTTDTTGRVYILDQMNAVIRVFSPRGEYLTSMLRDGDGPLEIRQPIGLEMLPGDSLLVYSTSSARIIAADRNGRIVQARSFRHPTPTLDMCWSGSSLFERTASVHKDGTVQRLAMNGTAELRFGALPQFADPAVRAQLGMGILECPPNGDWVVTATFDGPMIRAYDRAGDSIWTSEVAEFRQPEISVVDVGGSAGVKRPGTKPSDQVLSLVAVSDDALVAQVARIGAPEVIRGRRIWPIERIDSFLISADDGRGYYLGHALPHLIHAASSLLVGLISDPATGVPVVVAYEW